MQKHVNIDLKLLYKWLLANKISLNSTKTEVIFFHKTGHPINDYNFNKDKWTQNQTIRIYKISWYLP